MNLFAKRRVYTNAQLISFDNELTQLKNSFVLELLLTSVETFYKLHGHRIKRIREGIDTLNKKYFKYDKEGRPITYLAGVSHQGEVRCEVLNEGLTVEQYQKEFSDLLNATSMGVTLEKV